MRVLLVDDDTAILQALLPVLRARPGDEVRGATSGQKALENAAAMGGVDVLITDVVMQPMNGFALRTEMEARYPSMRTIFLTAYDLAEYEAQTQGAQTVTKPVNVDALHAALDRDFVDGRDSVEEARAANNGEPGSKVEPSRGSALAGVGATLPGGGSTSPIVPNRDAADQPAQIGGEELGDDSGDALVGQTVGSYQIVRQLGGGRYGTAYAAVQVSINRHVGLKILDASRKRDDATKARFIADARAKAHVQHPAIVSVYEAGEADGHIFYAHEYIEGENLAELQATGKKIDESSVLKVLRTIGEGLAYLDLQRIPHGPLEARKIYLAVNGDPRMANLATHHAEQQMTPEQEIRTLGRTLLSVAPAVQHISPGVRTLLSRMVQSGPQAFRSWGPLVEAVKALEPKIVPLEVAKISAADRAAIEAVEAARRERKKSLWLTAGTMALTLAAVVWVVWFYLFRSNERALEREIDIPAGEYLIGASARTVTLPAFSIDRYEVTIGQYAKFLAHLERNPNAAAEYNHPRQPRYADHRPKDWEIYYLRAKAGRPVHGVPTDLNAPMMMVTWWNAYAYAKWRGRELPTEEQWEAAARGPKGFIYPWGDEFDPKKANSNADHNGEAPSAKGNVDGYNFWNPVDSLWSDKSVFGVIGMAGNVSEWVATWMEDNRFPVVKGGNYLSADVRLDKRSTEYEPSRAEEHIGFRTVSNAAAKNSP